MQQINLYITSTGNDSADISLKNMVQGLVFIAFCAMLFYGYSFFQLSETRQEIEDSNKALVTEQARLAEITAEFLRQRSGMTLEQELRKVETDLAVQREIINTMKSGVLGNTRGYSEYMQAFARQVVNGLWLTGFKIEGDAVQMSISGAALSPELVPGYIKRLNNEKAMRGKTFTSLQMQLPKTDVGKQPATQYLEFNLQSVSAEEAEKK
jgi:hypothetical protein